MTEEMKSDTWEQYMVLSTKAPPLVICWMKKEAKMAPMGCRPPRKAAAMPLKPMAGTEDSDDSFIVGIKMIYRQMQDTLSALGLSEIEAIGKPFDPELMNAVMQAECEEGEESGEVKEVLQKGYMLNDRILRHAMVKVNK